VEKITGWEADVVFIAAIGFDKSDTQVVRILR
jgi:hypothetical protein